MKRIAAFFTALAICIVIVLGVHMLAVTKIDEDSLYFGTWINSYKDKSYTAIKQNIKDVTVLYLGSSEFAHCKWSAAHPSNIFRKSGMNVMCIGSAYNQSLEHAIEVGAFSKDMKNKKVSLIVSPGWFMKSGVQKQAFAMRFSESEFIELLKNSNISDEIKNIICDRAETLLSDNSNMLETVKVARKVYVDKKYSAYTYAKLKFSQLLQKESELVSVSFMWKQYKTATFYKEAKANYGNTFKAVDFPKLIKSTEKNCLQNISNKFNMADYKFYGRIQSILASKKNANTLLSYVESKEYSDLDLFLRVCKESGMEVQIVLQPLNGKWYDYTGMKRENWQVVSKKLSELCSNYSNVSLVDMTSYSDEAGFFQDEVHPNTKGWAIINEKVYEFFKQS